MRNNFIAKASVSVNAPLSKVWDALINPEIIRKYMFGTNVISDWKENGSIIWKGEWNGKQYEDKGVILSLIPRKLIKYSHYSPLSGQADEQKNYHIVTIELFENKTDVLINLTQDNNASEDEKNHSEKNWEMMLDSLKKTVEAL